MVHAAAVLIALLPALAQDASAPAPFPGNRGPKYPEAAEEEAVAGPVRFRATVDEKGAVQFVEILAVPAQELGFEEATRAAVTGWRFQPARLDGRNVEGVYEGSVQFSLLPDIEQELGDVVRRAFENWGRPPARGRVEDTPRTLIRGRTETPTSVLEAALQESFGNLRGARSIAVDGRHPIRRGRRFRHVDAAYRRRSGGARRVDLDPHGGR